MNNYDFKTLNDKEFEMIARDLLNAKFKLQLQDFSVGPDKGVDLRYSTQKNNNSIVVQAKHYADSGFSQLKSTFKNSELPKVKNLNPDRYIIVTSLSLTSSQKDDLKKILLPYVVTSNDIHGREDLNSYLSEFSNIESKYFKLWFSSIAVFDRLLNNAVGGRTEYLLKSLQSKIKFYVVTKKLEEALEVLSAHKMLLITGQPGIGKTTLAEMILFERARSGYKVYKVEDLREAESTITPGDEKQLFYFDDFLGSNYLEIASYGKKEAEIPGFIDRIKHTPNKYLILTTRTIILNHAVASIERIGQSKLVDNKFEIALSDYSPYEKALILYNHLYFKAVSENIYKSILQHKFYKTIIEHDNYVPRLIDFLTDPERINKLSPKDYNRFVTNNLNNPQEIWRWSFEVQITYFDRCFLLTAFTFTEYSIDEKELRQAFQGRLNFEREFHNQIIRSNQFNESLKTLLSGFIISYIYDFKDSSRRFKFINPSLKDFLIGYVKDSFGEMKSIISSLVYLEQLELFDPEDGILPLEVELQKILYNKVVNGDLRTTRERTLNFTKSQKHAMYIEVLVRFCSKVQTDTHILGNLRQIDIADGWDYYYQIILTAIQNAVPDSEVFNYVSVNFDTIIRKLIASVNHNKDALLIPTLFEKYGNDYTVFVETDEGFSSIHDMIYNLVGINEDELISDNSSEVTSIEEVEELYSKLDLTVQKLEEVLFPNTYIDFNFDTSYNPDFWDDKIAKNLHYDTLSDGDEKYHNLNHNLLNRGKDESEMIDDLFTFPK